MSSIRYILGYQGSDVISGQDIDRIWDTQYKDCSLQWTKHGDRNVFVIARRDERDFDFHPY